MSRYLKHTYHVLLCALLFFIGTSPLEGMYLNKGIPLDLTHYCFFDLGPTNLAERCLDRHCWPMSLAPRININGQVIGNRGERGFVWTKHQGFITYSHDGYYTCFVDINNDGTVLGMVKINDEYSEWFLWTEHQCIREGRAPFLLCDKQYSNHVYLRALNDHGNIVGARLDECGCYRSIFWDEKKCIRDLPYPLLWDINNSNYMLGSEPMEFREQPITWHIKGGMNVINDDRRFGKPYNIRSFFNPVIAEDTSVYGNFIANKWGSNYTYAYMWNACDAIFRPLDLNQMLISSVNKCHVLVGTLQGQAVMSKNHGPPIPLVSLVINKPSGWQLINATDINDKGQIVGWGRKSGEIRFFMLDPIR
ncbi:MAG: hypothetical protein AAGG81_02410 [Chlamydiota bacterium]